MKKAGSSISVALFFSSIGLLPAHSFAGSSIEPCTLYTKADAEALFTEEVSDGFSRKTTAPAGTACRYTFTRDSNAYKLDLRIADDAALRGEGIFDSAADTMARQKKARQNNTYAAKRFQEISSLGDDAFWDGTSLWLRKGKTLLVISVNSPLEGSFPNAEAMESARARQDRALSLKVAETILGRLN